MMASCVGMRKAKYNAEQPSYAPHIGCGGGEIVPSQDLSGITQNSILPQRENIRTFSAGSSTDSGKENTSFTKQPTTTTNSSFLARVYSKLRGSKPRVEKCEKCGQKSEMFQASNDTSVSGRKVFLCERCRQSSDTMKGLYEQLWRTLSVHDPPRLVGGRRVSGGDLASPAASSSRQQRGVVRARSMKTPRPAMVAPDSGYDTATSLDSSCSNGRLSPEPVVECRRVCFPPHPEPCPQQCYEVGPALMSYSVRSNALVPARDKGEVFRGGDVRSDHAQPSEIQAGPLTRVYTRPPPPYRPRQTSPPSHPPHHHPQLGRDAINTTNYDGYLEIRTPNSNSVKYVFRPREDQEPRYSAVEVIHHHSEDDVEVKGSDQWEEKLKRCYRCHQLRSIAFRAPFCNGWLCEDCSDDLV